MKLESGPGTVARGVTEARTGDWYGSRDSGERKLIKLKSSSVALRPLAAAAVGGVPVRPTVGEATSRGRNRNKRRWMRKGVLLHKGTDGVVKRVIPDQIQQWAAREAPRAYLEAQRRHWRKVMEELVSWMAVRKWEAAVGVGKVEGVCEWSADVAGGSRLGLELRGRKTAFVVQELVDTGAQVSVMTVSCVRRGGWRVQPTRLFSPGRGRRG